MSTPRQTRNEIHQLLRLLLDSDIALHISQTVLDPISSHIRVGWPSTDHGWKSGFDNPFGSFNEYLAWLQFREYSAVLFDASILQISFNFHRNRLISHRLVYYPCPLELDSSDLDLLNEEPILDVIDIYMNDSGRFRARSPIRFDFNADSMQLEHPASHMTMLTNECRMPVYGPVSLGHFIDFVFRNFYSDIWQQHEFIREWPTSIEQRTISTSEQRYLHISAHER